MTSFNRQLDPDLIKRVHEGRGRELTHKHRARPDIVTAIPREERAQGAHGSRLTAREREVVTLVGRGYSNPEIARSLFVSVETVKSHVRHILSKLGARTRAHAVVLAVKSEQVSLADL